MEYSIESLREEFRKFWKAAKESVHYKMNGIEIYPEQVLHYSLLNFTEGDYGDGFNFSCKILNLQVQVENLEQLYNAECIIKVVPTIVENCKPAEKITAIKDNSIYLYKR